MNDRIKNLAAFSPVILDLIQYYYNELDNCTGGNLHVVLDDGNLDDQMIWACQEDCEKKGDHFGYLIATVLRGFNLEQRESMYAKYWGMEALNRINQLTEGDSYGIRL